MMRKSLVLVLLCAAFGAFAQTDTVIEPMGPWSAAKLPPGTWSARELLGAPVVVPDGEKVGQVKDILVETTGAILDVVVEVGGWRDLGDQHIGIPWRDVEPGPGLKWIEVPLAEVEPGSYALYGYRPQGEHVPVYGFNWRIRELIGEDARLQDIPRYGLVTDVLFDRDGQAQAVVVERRAGPWGPAGRYVYPYISYQFGRPAYVLPYSAADVERYGTRLR